MCIERYYFNLKGLIFQFWFVSLHFWVYFGLIRKDEFLVSRKTFFLQRYHLCMCGFVILVNKCMHVDYNSDYDD